MEVNEANPRFLGIAAKCVDVGPISLQYIITAKAKEVFWLA